MKQRDECDINLLEKLGLFVVLEKSDCSSLSRNPWRIYSTNTWGNPTETRGQPANHHPVKTPAGEAWKAPNYNKIWFYFRFLAFRLGPVPRTKSHACWAYGTLSRNFLLNLKFYSIYRIYTYIQHAFKCAIFYHKHSPACKVKAKDRNIGPLYFMYVQAKFSQVIIDTGYFAYFHSFAVTLRTFIFGYKNSIFFYRRRSYEMKKIRFRKSCCIGKNPVLPEVIYRYLISFPWISCRVSNKCCATSHSNRHFPEHLFPAFM